MSYVIMLRTRGLTLASLGGNTMKPYDADPLYRTILVRYGNSSEIADGGNIYAMGVRQHTTVDDIAEMLRNMRLPNRMPIDWFEIEDTVINVHRYRL